MQNISSYPKIPKNTKGRETFYEYPLNGQVRTYLRLECLLQRLEANSKLANGSQSEMYFQSLFGLCVLLAKIHVRGDLVKDLTRLREKFKTWAQNPDINRKHLDNLCTQSYILQQQLLQAPRLAQGLRDDHFLLSFRQRFEVPAGTCSFDTPHLSYWLCMPEEHLKACTHEWNKELAPVSEALFFWLQMTRQNAEMQEKIIKKGYYQQEAPEKQIVQIKMNTEYNVYPVVNNYKSRFTVRLIPFNEEDAIAEEIKVSLAAC